MIGVVPANLSGQEQPPGRGRAHSRSTCCHERLDQSVAPISHDDRAGDVGRFLVERQVRVVRAIGDLRHRHSACLDNGPIRKRLVGLLSCFQQTLGGPLPPQVRQASNPTVFRRRGAPWPGSGPPPGCQRVRPAGYQRRAGTLLAADPQAPRVSSHLRHQYEQKPGDAARLPPARAGGCPRGGRGKLTRQRPAPPRQPGVEFAGAAPRGGHSRTLSIRSRAARSRSPWTFPPAIRPRCALGGAVWPGEPYRHQGTCACRRSAASLSAGVRPAPTAQANVRSWRKLTFGR